MKDPTQHQAVINAANAAGIIDVETLQIADLSKTAFDSDGSIKDPAGFIAALKSAKPHLFAKHARDMTQTERDTWLRELIRRNALADAKMRVPTKHVSEMTDDEYQQALRKIGAPWSRNAYKSA